MSLENFLKLNLEFRKGRSLINANNQYTKAKQARNNS